MRERIGKRVRCKVGRDQRSLIVSNLHPGQKCLKPASLTGRPGSMEGRGSTPPQVAAAAPRKMKYTAPPCTAPGPEVVPFRAAAPDRAPKRHKHRQGRTEPSCRILSCPTLNHREPMRCCGLALQQVLNEQGDAPAHQRRHVPGWRWQVLRWPYQAKVMKMLLQEQQKWFADGN